MKILFFTTVEADYLQDSVLHGLRCLFNNNLIDYPKKNILYKDYKENDIYGRGFTLYRTLNNIEVDRKDITIKLVNGYFDLVIFGSIHRQLKFIFGFEKYLSVDKTMILDGEDTPVLFPNHWIYKKYPIKLFRKKLYNNFFYFKREISDDTNYFRFLKSLPKSITNKIKLPGKIRTISFSIPEEKIISTLPVKKKLFTKHIVDEEVSTNVEGSYTKYAFESELDYYADIQSSKYGITTKRAGWDCLRHYEIAANGAVICFKDLDKKPETCAPHGLIPGINCISYKNYDDLTNQIANIDDECYNNLLFKSLDWIKKQTSITRAQELLNILIYENNKN